MLRYTKSEMLAVWRRRLGVDTLMAEASVERTDGIDLDGYITLAMRQWYLRALDTAPLSALLVEDIYDETEPVRDPHDDTLCYIPRDPSWRRITGVQLFGWHLPLVPRDYASAARALEWLASDFTRPSVREPMAVFTPRGLLCAPVVRNQVISLTVVRDPGPEIYLLDESLLGSIPSSIDQIMPQF